MRLSASKVDCFFGCPRQFKYKYLAPPFKVPQNRYFLIGNIAHHALEGFYKANGETLSEKADRSKLLRKHFKLALVEYKAAKNIQKGIITEKDIIDIRDMLKGYLSIIPTGTGGTAHTEEFFEIKIDGVDVAGKADRIDSENGVYTVVDYKTSKKPKFDPNSVQIPTYAMWLQDKLGLSLDQIRGEYYYLRHITKKSGIQEFEITEENIQMARDKYREVAAAIEDSETKYPKNHKHYCFVCDFKSYCMGDNNDYVD